ncbi:hypothetical protein ACFL0H_10710 [Thermodesulfobacteriota bacterium]
MDEIKRVLDLRNPMYGKAGDFVVDTTHLSIREAADLIIKEILQVGGN